MPVRWETTRVDGRDMRIYLGVPERQRERPACASWHEMLAFFTEHLKRGATG